MAPDPKPARRRKANADEWGEIRRRRIGYGIKCRICGDRDAVSLHHLVSKSLGGGDVDENLVELCGSGTSGCHGAVEHRERWALTRLRANLRRRELTYMVNTKSQAFVDRYYPERF